MTLRQEVTRAIVSLEAEDVTVTPLEIQRYLEGQGTSTSWATVKAINVALDELESKGVISSRYKPSKGYLTKRIVSTV